MDEEILFEKDGLKFIKIKKNNYNLVFSIENENIVLSKIIGFNGSIVFDKSKPNGTPRKLLDSSMLLGLGWLPMVDLEVGIRKTYQWFLSNEAKGKLL